MSSFRALTYCICCLLLLPTLAIAQVTYNPTQLDQFFKTNQCPGCDLSNAKLGSEGLNHSGAKLANANLTEATMDNMNFSESDMTGVFLTGAIANGTNFSFVKFNNANLIQAKFPHSNFIRADFTGAILTDADFSRADLYQATITSTQLSSAKTYCEAIMPDGSKGPPC